jgi:hypothetical protein
MNQQHKTGSITDILINGKTFSAEETPNAEFISEVYQAWRIIQEDEENISMLMFAIGYQYLTGLFDKLTELSTTNDRNKQAEEYIRSVWESEEWKDCVIVDKEGNSIS